jgi:peptidyl-tRNA hydrolase, PTH1 family
VRLPGRKPPPTLDNLVVGLGNPGPRYRDTRHNAGFRVVEELARRLDAGSPKSKHGGRLWEVRDGDLRLALLAPETYMNESGQSVATAMRFYKLPVEQLLVVHDEIDLPFGDVRAKAGGGLAGHNGLRSVAGALGTGEFERVRVGIGRPERGDPRPVADWVLLPFDPGVDVDALVQRGADCAQTVVRDGIDAAMRSFNGR